MSKKVTEADLDILGQLGIDSTPVKKASHSNVEQRVIAGFEEIQRFVQENGRRPQHGENNDIFERLYAVRLERLVELQEYRELLAPYDTERLLTELVVEDSLENDISDDDLLASLGVETSSGDDITQLKHVRTRAEIRAAEEVAQRNVCEDFEKFRPIFDVVLAELKSGVRETRPFKGYSMVEQRVEVRHLFILEGQTLLVASAGEGFIDKNNQADCRLRVIYDNGTEVDILQRSLLRALNKDETSRRITEPTMGPLFTSDVEDEDTLAGHIYVLRSQSDNPFVAENRAVIHKIGVTGGEVKKRIANAKKDPTYLLADVIIVQSFKLYDVNRAKLESLIHKFFASARLDLAFKDRFGQDVEPKEWFLVPLPVIEEAIQKLMDGSISEYQYDPETAEIVKI